LREDYETLQNRYNNALKIYKPTSNSRRASFINARKLLLHIYKGNTLHIVEEGKQDGTDKNAFTCLLSICASKRADNDDLVFGIWAHYLYARHPSNWYDEQIASVSEHCLARMMQTVGVKNAYDVRDKFLYSLTITFPLTRECQLGERTYDQQFAILSEHGVIVAEYKEKYGMTFCETAIAYTAMSPKKAKILQKLFNKGDRIINWKK